MLRFTTLIAVSIAAAQPALAAGPVQYGEGDGHRFEYTTELRANGFIHIAGTVLDTAQPFVLDVSPAGAVDGNFGDVAVEYHVSKQIRDTAAAQLTAGPALAEASPTK